MCLSLSACVDDSYDMSKDVDMTVGLGSDGLKLKLGSTEKILLKDILDVDDDSNVSTTESGLYYLVEKGETEFSFNVPQVNVAFDDAELTPVIKVADFSKVAGILGGGATARLTVPSGLKVGAENVEATSNMDFAVDDISEDIKTIKNVELTDGHFNMTLEIEQTPGVDFVISSVRNLKIHLPSYVRLDGVPGGVVSIADCNPGTSKVDLGSTNIKAVEFAPEMGQEIVGGKLSLRDKVYMKGDFELKSRNSFAMDADDYANVRLTISTKGSNGIDVVVCKVKGCFNPDIDPDIAPISIGENLPDFLKDEEVRVMVSNPTVKFGVDMSQMPVAIDMSGKLTASGRNVPTMPVYLPKGADNGAKVELGANRLSTLYFYQGEKPFDPQGVEQSAHAYSVDNISDLITVIPEHINVDMSDGMVEVKQGVLHTIELGRDYKAETDYSVYVPFVFDSGMKIVYNDSIDGMNKDLKDYEADGVTITAEILNTIPLDLLAKIVPVDVDGNPLPGITVNDANVAAAQNGQPTSTNIELTITLANRSDLRLLDKLRFRIEALSVDSDSLSSDQYLIVKDIRLKLNGQVTADFN